jgi:hypothetical protein
VSVDGWNGELSLACEIILKEDLVGWCDVQSLVEFLRILGALFVCYGSYRD